MDGKHECAAPGCTKLVDNDKLMCVGHWKALPLDIQREVWLTWRRVHRDPNAYRVARQRAVDWQEKNGTARQGGFF